MIKALHEGVFTVGSDGKFAKHAPDTKAKRGKLVVGINPFLIKTKDTCELIDAGFGPFGPEDHHSLLLTNLENAEVDAESITSVYCSHLHTDHVGGLLYEQYGTFRCTFPNASIWLSGKDWQRFKENADEKGHDFAIKWALFLETHANLRFTEDTKPDSPYIRIETIGGHTRYHQGIFYENGKDKAMMLGDVLGRPEAVNRSFTAKYDHDGRKSQELRNKYLEKAYKENYLLLAYHGVHNTIFSLTDYHPQKGYEIQPTE